MTSPRVLVVDDEADLRELLEITLLKMGLDVDSTETLQHARQLFAEKDYQLVLTDMRLPDGLGLELVREVTASGGRSQLTSCSRPPKPFPLRLGRMMNCRIGLQRARRESLSA